MTDKLTLAAKARALIDETDPDAVRQGLREIADALEANRKLPPSAMRDIHEAAEQPFVDALRDRLFLAAMDDDRFNDFDLRG
jgi:hypothetical protein